MPISQISFTLPKTPTFSVVPKTYPKISVITPPQKHVVVDPDAEDFFGHPIIRGEVPVGDIDGNNKIFRTTRPLTNPIRWIYLNGIPFVPEDYNVIMPNQIVTVEAPLPGDSLIIDYLL